MTLPAAMHETGGRMSDGNELRGVVLAGGTGSRLFPLTKVTNKHLLPVGREPMIFHPVKKLIEAGVREILIVTGTDHIGAVVSPMIHQWSNAPGGVFACYLALAFLLFGGEIQAFARSVAELAARLGRPIKTTPSPSLMTVGTQQVFCWQVTVTSSSSTLAPELTVRLPLTGAAVK